MLIGAIVLPEKEVWCGEHGPESGYPKFIFGSITASYGTWGETLLALTSHKVAVRIQSKVTLSFGEEKKVLFIFQPGEKRIRNISWHKYHLSWVKA